MAFEIGVDIGLRYQADEFDDAQFDLIVAGYQTRIEHDWQIAAWQTSHILNTVRAAVGVKGDLVTPEKLLGGAFRRKQPATATDEEE